MNDIVPEILEAIKQDFDRGVDTSRLISRLTKLLETNKATFRHANQYAETIGKILSSSLLTNLDVSKMPNEKLYYNIISRILESTLATNHKMITDYSSSVCSDLNTKANIGVSVIKPKMDKDRLTGLINKAVSIENTTEALTLLRDGVVNFSQNITDTLIKSNADFHHRIGLSPKIKRISTGRCCEWCSNLAGTYGYPVADEVYRRHKNCDCIVEYYPADGRVQNAYTKKWR